MTKYHIFHRGTPARPVWWFCSSFRQRHHSPRGHSDLPFLLSSSVREITQWEICLITVCVQHFRFMYFTNNYGFLGGVFWQGEEGFKHNTKHKHTAWKNSYTEPYDPYTGLSYPSHTSDHVTYLNPLFIAGSLDDPLDIDVRYMDVLRGNFPDLHNLLYLSDRDAACLTHRRVEVTGCLPAHIVLKLIRQFLASFHHLW